MSTFGQRIKELRLSRNLSQLSLAESLDITRGNISKLEGDKVAPTASTLLQLAQHFNVTCEWLMTGINTSESNTFSINDKEQHIITCYRQLSKEDQLLFLGRLEGASGNY